MVSCTRVLWIIFWAMPIYTVIETLNLLENVMSSLRWYIAISNCGSDKGLDVTYRFKMTNGKPGEFWHEHFSADERSKPLRLILKYRLLDFLHYFDFFFQ